MSEICLIDLKNNESAVVKTVLGENASRRLEALGVRPGKTIKKTGSHFWGGPITIIVGSTKIAIGRGMAEKIMVEI